MTIEAARMGLSYPKTAINCAVSPFIGEPRDLGRYRESVTAISSETREVNPSTETIELQMKASLSERYRKGEVKPIAIPNLSPLITSIVIFSDQQKGNISWDVYPSEEKVEEYYGRIEERYGQTAKKLTIPELFDIGMDEYDQTFRALSLLTIGTRHIARGMETRAYPNIKMDLDRRLELASKIAPLPEHFGEKEHPGAIYTFGYQSVTSYSTTEAAGTKRVRAMITDALVEHLPDLAALRKVTNPDAVSFGNHKEVARAGFSLGRNLANFERGLIQKRDAS